MLSPLKPLLPIWLVLLLTGCGLFVSLPDETTINDRLDVLASMPAPHFDGPVEIYWSEHLIPHIAAKTDSDAAMALGIVHAHLRLGQMEFIKRAAAGRLSEMIDKYGVKIDAAVRAVDYYHKADEYIRNMPEATRAWMLAYVAGINHYKQHIVEFPHDMIIGDMDNEPWTAEDSIAIGRLASSDINWMTMAALLPLREKDNWQDIISTLMSHGEELYPSFPVSLPEISYHRRDIEMFAKLLTSVARFGSNSLAVSGERSSSGSPILSNEPHLGFIIPNLWVIVGIDSPSYRVVGLTSPGIPIVALGRNPHISWGGTNMRAFSSDIVEVTGEPMTEISHEIHRRFGKISRAKNRVSAVGPVISDAKMFDFPKRRDFALRWMGHQPSDELTAYLGVMRATGWRVLKTALSSYGSPGQNMLFADKDGTIGQFSAGWFPARTQQAPQDLWVDRQTSDKAWETTLTVDDLPSIINPQDGVVASANNMPTQSAPTRMAWTYPRDDRIRRMYELIQSRSKWDIAGLQTIHADTYSRAHHRLNREIVDIAENIELDEDAEVTLEALRHWDGYFAVDSKSAYVHIGVVEEIVDELYDELDREDEVKMWWNSTFLPNQLTVDLREAVGVDVEEIVADALSDSDSLVKNEKLWGDVHRLRVSYIAGNLPVGGKKYRLYELEAPGGVETLMKSAHSLTADKHYTYFGSQSRHYSDMSDDDENYFVLFGGQDGWLNSENFADQVPLWADGKMIRVPLRLESVKSHYPHIMRFAGGEQQDN